MLWGLASESGRVHFFNISCNTAQTCYRQDIADNGSWGRQGPEGTGIYHLCYSISEGSGHKLSIVGQDLLAASVLWVSERPMTEP